MGEEKTLRQLNHTLILFALFIYSDNVSRNDSAGSLESNHIHPLPGKDNGEEDVKLWCLLQRDRDLIHGDLPDQQYTIEYKKKTNAIPLIAYKNFEKAVILKFPCPI